MSGDSVNFSYFVPRVPCHPSRAYVSHLEVESGQALVRQNLHFQLARRVNPSLSQCVSRSVIVQQRDFFALQAINFPFERAEDITRQISDGRSFTYAGSPRKLQGGLCCNLLKHICDNRIVDPQIDGELKRPLKNCLSRRKCCWIDMSAVPIYRIEPKRICGIIGRHCGSSLAWSKLPSSFLGRFVTEPYRGRRRRRSRDAADGIQGCVCDKAGGRGPSRREC